MEVEEQQWEEEKMEEVEHEVEGQLEEEVVWSPVCGGCCCGGGGGGCCGGGGEMLEALREPPHLISVSRHLAHLPHYWLSVIDCSCLTLPPSLSPN